MTPKTPLELKLPGLDDLLLDDLEMIFETGGAKPREFKAFMLRYSNWTAKEIGLLSRKEAREIMDKIISDVLEKSVPKESAAPS